MLYKNSHEDRGANEERQSVTPPQPNYRNLKRNLDALSVCLPQMANCNLKGRQVPARMSSRLPLALFRCSRTLSPLLRPSLAFSMSSQSPAAGKEPEIPHFEFAEEPLGLPASEGFGYFQGRPGLVFGPDKRFKLQTKLGFGTTSSVWLARDSM